MSGQNIMNEIQAKAGRLAKRYMKEYRGYMEDLDKSPLAKCRSITEYDIVALGKQLDSWRDYQSQFEDDGNVSALGQLPKLALDVLAMQYGVSPLNVICSVQPLDEVQGIVYFRELIAQNTRGNVNAGDKLFQALGLPDVYTQGYLGANTVANFVVNGSGIGPTTVSLGGSQDHMSPIDPQQCYISGTTAFNTHADLANWGTMQADPDTGIFSCNRKVNGTVYGILGTVNFATGSVTYEFNVAPSATYINLTATYQVLQEAGTDLSKATMKLVTKPVVANWYSLKETMGMQEQYVLRKRFGMNGNDIMAEDLMMLMNMELMNQVVTILQANVPSNAVNTWARQSASGVGYFEHKMTIEDAITDTGRFITKNSGKGTPNVWVAGLQVCAILETLPKFKKLFDDVSFGPHVYGTYNGTTVVRVPYDGLFDDDLMIGLYKGSNPFDAPLAYCPYMPIVLTNEAPYGYNPLQTQRAVANYSGFATMNTNLLCKLTVDETGFDYTSG